MTNPDPSMEDRNVETKKVDEFMQSLGFILYPSEQTWLPNSTRWYKPNSAPMSDGGKTHYHVQVYEGILWYSLIKARDERREVEIEQKRAKLNKIIADYRLLEYVRMYKLQKERGARDVCIPILHDVELAEFTELEQSLTKKEEAK